MPFYPTEMKSPEVASGDYKDQPMAEGSISKFGMFLLAHTNLTLYKFFQAFLKTNIKMIVKSASLCNNIISFSKDQLRQTKNLDLLSFEKESLRSEFNHEKHHLVVAMNIFLYLNRHGILILDC